jgi:hypothetical protein
MRPRQLHLAHPPVGLAQQVVEPAGLRLQLESLLIMIHGGSELAPGRRDPPQAIVRRGRGRVGREGSLVEGPGAFGPVAAQFEIAETNQRRHVGLECVGGRELVDRLLDPSLVLVDDTQVVVPARLIRCQGDGVAVADRRRQPQGVAVVELAEPAECLTEAHAVGARCLEQRRQRGPLVLELASDRRFHARQVRPRQLFQRHLVDAPSTRRRPQGQHRQARQDKRPHPWRPLPHGAPPSIALPLPWRSM